MNPLEGVQPRHFDPAQQASSSSSSSASDSAVHELALSQIKELASAEMPEDLLGVRKRLVFLETAVAKIQGSLSEQVKTAIKTLIAAEKTFMAQEQADVQASFNRISEIGVPPTWFLFFRGARPEPQTLIEDLSLQLSSLNRYLRIANPLPISEREIQAAISNLNDLKENYKNDPGIPPLVDLLGEAINEIKQKQVNAMEREFHTLEETKWMDDIKANLPRGVNTDEIFANDHLNPLLKAMHDELNKDDPNFDNVIQMLKSVQGYAKSGIRDADAQEGLNTILYSIIQDKPDARLSALMHAPSLEACKIEQPLIKNSEEVAKLYTYLVSTPRVTIEGVEHASVSVDDAGRLGGLFVDGKAVPLNPDRANYQEYFTRLAGILKDKGLNQNQVINLESFINQAAFSEVAHTLANNTLRLGDERQDLMGLATPQIKGTFVWKIEVKQETVAIEARLAFKGLVVTDPQVPLGVICGKMIVTLPKAKLDAPYGEVKDLTGASMRVILSDRITPYADANDEEIARINQQAIDAIDNKH